MSSKAEQLFYKWVNNPELGYFWYNHTICCPSVEVINGMTTTQLRHLKCKVNDYKQCLKDSQGKGISNDMIEGYDYVKKLLNELEEKYYYSILNTHIDFKDSNKTIEHIPSHNCYDKGERTTYKTIFTKASTMILRDYAKRNKEAATALITTCYDINFTELLEAKEAEQEIINALPLAEKNKHYEKKRREKTPEKERERKENGLARLKDWQEENPEKYRTNNNESSKKSKLKAKDLTACETTEAIAAKVVRLAIDKVLTKIANAERYKLRKQLKEQPN